MHTPLTPDLSVNASVPGAESGFCRNDGWREWESEHDTGAERSGNRGMNRPVRQRGTAPVLWQKGCTSADPTDLDAVSKFRDICVPQNCIWQADKHSLCSILYCGLKSSYRLPAECAAAARKCWTDAEAAERSRSNWSCPTGHQRPRWSYCEVSNEFIYPIQVRKFKLSRLHVLYF